MSPFAVAVILILTSLFVLLSMIPLLSNQPDGDTFDPSQTAKTNNAS